MIGKQSVIGFGTMRIPTLDTEISMKMNIKKDARNRSNAVIR